MYNDTLYYVCDIYVTSATERVKYMLLITIVFYNQQYLTIISICIIIIIVVNLFSCRSDTYVTNII